MLHPTEYREFCLIYVYRFINHDDTISEKNLEYFVEDTERAWKRRNDARKEAEEELRNWKPPQPVEPVVPLKATGIKGKIIRSFLKIKRKSKTDITPYDDEFYNLINKPPEPKNGYRNKKHLLSGTFKGGFNEGDYDITAEDKTNGEKEKAKLSMNDTTTDTKDNSTSKADNLEIGDEKAANEKSFVGIETTPGLPSIEKTIPEEVKTKALEESHSDPVKIDKNEIFYDKKNISYHDKSECIDLRYIISFFDD